MLRSVLFLKISGRRSFSVLVILVIIFNFPSKVSIEYTKYGVYKGPLDIGLTTDLSQFKESTAFPDLGNLDHLFLLQIFSWKKWNKI